MERKKFFEQYKDPRWQKKRLEIMQRDAFTCVLCKDKETTLNIHHKKYINGKKPWEYEDDDLITLCEDCHANIEFFKKEKKEHDITEIFGGFHETYPNGNKVTVLYSYDAHIITHIAKNKEVISRIVVSSGKFDFKYINRECYDVQISSSKPTCIKCDNRNVCYYSFKKRNIISIK